MIRDDVADGIVSADPKLQDHIHARTLMLWLPGMSAGIAVQLCLLIAGISIALSLLLYWPLEAEHFKYYIAGIAIGSVPMAVLSNLLVRGMLAARKGMLVLSVSYACVALIESLYFVLVGRGNSANIAVIGLLGSLAAVRLITGPSYALLAAIYRAQRVRLQSLNRTNELGVDRR